MVILIIQTIKDFNLLYNILNDARKVDDEIHSNKPDTLQYSYLDANNVAKTKCDFVNNIDPDVINPLTYHYSINNFLGLLSENNQKLVELNAGQKH